MKNKYKLLVMLPLLLLMSGCFSEPSAILKVEVPLGQDPWQTISMDTGVVSYATSGFFCKLDTYATRSVGLAYIHQGKTLKKSHYRKLYTVKCYNSHE